MPAPAIQVTALNGAQIRLAIDRIGLLVAKPRGCCIWDPELRYSIRARESLPTLLQAIENTRTITHP